MHSSLILSAIIAIVAIVIIYRYFASILYAELPATMVASWDARYIIALASVAAVDGGFTFVTSVVKFYS
jgi:divalent metal cation (Fe/Co/Zn/Cd) transporter